MGPLSMHGDLVVPLRFALGLAAAVPAVLFMDAVMARLPEGETPPQVASGVLTGTSPDEAPRRLAAVVHYVAGLLTGPLFVWLLLVAEGLLGAGIVATAVADLALFVLMVGFFVFVVLPRSRLEPGRAGAVRRDWVTAVAAYLLVVVPVVHAGSLLL
ncbi:hypothetical protein BRC63_07390 [Halobacteriales archaeon QH_10_70_21]|jgi:hypothetical protein|nr:MAG: hypothetical protein BRC63_07390 [Halobacteriales archaeon QH_10_70_21]